MNPDSRLGQRERPIRSILIVGGGTAGWLTASVLAATHLKNDSGGEQIKITLIEAPDIPIVGVGEGTWPSMRATLHKAGIKESDFLTECNASFKQGTKFVGWKNGRSDDYYYHPFDLPRDFSDVNMAQYWSDQRPEVSFSKFACVQEHLCEQDLSPKLRHSGAYSGVANYGYHLDAGKFSEFIKRHCVENLGVKLVADRVTDVVSYNSGECPDDISHVVTEASGNLEADLFVDCTGFRSLLLGRHYGIDFIDKSVEFPANSALAIQVPYADGEPVKSATLSTAKEAGWIWDIGLSSRRGVGLVYSNNHATEGQATQCLQSYLGLSSQAFDQLSVKSIAITPGHRKKFWHQNCVAVGLSAGFLEPLEASAMALIETSVAMISDMLPITRAAMDVVSTRFNRRYQYRWERIIDFLTLHYYLSERQDAFWVEASSYEHLSDRLREDLELWQYQAPWKADFDSLEEAFPSASYQYVLYGMGFKTRNAKNSSYLANEVAAKVAHEATLLTSKVEANRSILDLING